jgi:chitin disaccharide deacetylase
MGGAGSVAAVTAASLVERLGFGPDDRLVILKADELGLTRASNVGVYDALRHGAATSASLMVPAPWARDAAAGYRGEDVGVHLTLNAEWDTYRWGPISHSPSLRDGDGGFPRTIEDLWDHGDIDEVRKEGRAQVERAIYWGFDVSHLDSHIGALLGRPEFFDAYLELALEFGLPLRLPGEATQRLVGFPFRKLAAEEGAVFPDHLVAVPRELTGRGGARRAIERALFELAPGVTEIQTHPAIDTDELRAACPDWPGRVEDHAYLRHDPSLPDLVERAGATLIGYRDLRDLVRAD